MSAYSQIQSYTCRSGIMPVYDRLLSFGETVADDEKIKRYLLEIGFTESTPSVTAFLARLIGVCVRDDGFKIGRECEKAARKSGKDALSLRLGYYVSKNHARVRERIMRGYGVDIGESGGGNKKFVRKLAAVYSVYYEPNILPLYLH